MEDLGIDQVVAFNMRRWRTAAGLTQEELGQRIGWTGANVSSAERSADPGRDRRRFDAALLVSLTTALGVPLAALFLPPPGTGGPAMAALFARILPDSLADSPAMDAYRIALAEAARDYLDPGKDAGLIAYLDDMTDKSARVGRVTRMVTDLREFEREYRRRMIAYFEEQIEGLRAGAEDDR